jgi:chaperonin cofactor prefoldin
MSYKELQNQLDRRDNILNKKIDRLTENMEKLIDKSEAIHIQATKTNGRVTRLESKEQEYDYKLRSLEESDRKQQSWIDTTKGKIFMFFLVLSTVLNIGLALI